MDDISDIFSKLNLQGPECSNSSGISWKCQFYPCYNMRELIVHIKKCVMECSSEWMCKTPHCQTTLSVYRHWLYCIADNCMICEPVKQLIAQGSLEPESTINNIFLKKIPSLLAQHHLRMIVHCKECRNGKNCSEYFCPQVCDLLNHAHSCMDDSCDYFSCIIAKRSLSHLKNCEITGCKSCGPLKGTYTNTLQEYAECIRYQMLLFYHSDVCLRKLMAVSEENPEFSPLPPSEGSNLVRLFTIVPDDILSLSSAQFQIKSK